MGTPERKKVKLAHAEIGRVEGCQSKCKESSDLHSKNVKTKIPTKVQQPHPSNVNCTAGLKSPQLYQVQELSVHTGIGRVEGCHSNCKESGDLHSKIAKFKSGTGVQQAHPSNVDCTPGLKSPWRYQGQELSVVQHDRTVNTWQRHKGQGGSGKKRRLEEVAAKHSFISKKDGCSVYNSQLKPSIQNEQGAEIINLVSDGEEDDDDVVYDTEEVIISDANYQQEQQKPQISQQQAPVLTFYEQQDNKEVVIDEELQAAIREASQLCCRKQKNIAMDPQKVKMLATISDIAKQMIQELGDNSVDVEALKEALLATKYLYKQGSNWYDNWTSAAQNYMVGQHEVAEAAQREAEALRTAMAESLGQKKLVCNMSLQELFVEFTNKSYCLKGIFNIVEENVILGLQTPELTDSCRKVLELEKSCFKWYKFYEDTLKAYFDSLLKNKKLITIQRKMSTLDQKSPRTQRRYKIDCAKEFCNIFLEWHQVLSDSILEFEQNEDKQHALPKVFHDFLVPQNQETIEILD